MTGNYSIKAVSRLTGLTPHVIRVWEKRYRAVQPGRTGTNRRLYSEEEAERLGLLRRATLAGHSISAIASLPREKLLKLVEEAKDEERPVAVEKASASGLVQRGVDATTKLETRTLEEVLREGILKLGHHGLLTRIIGPLAQRVGVLWQEGTISAAHEHFATAVIRAFLSRNTRPFPAGPEAPVLIVATPVGQLHELGAVMAAAAATDAGWNVVYLGTSLPAAEIAGAAIQHRARAVALSIVYPADDANLATELENLRGYLPPATLLLAGGRAASAYGEVLGRVGAKWAEDVTEVYRLLDEIRKPKERPQAEGSPKSDVRSPKS